MIKYKEQFINILADVLEIDVDDIPPIDEYTCLIGNIGNGILTLSSIDYVEFLVKVEQEFDIVYNFETRINTIGDLISYIDMQMYDKGSIS